MMSAPRISCQRHDILLAVHHAESSEQIAFAFSLQTRPEITAPPARKDLRGTKHTLLDRLLLFKGIQAVNQILGGLTRLYIYDNHSFILFTFTR